MFKVLLIEDDLMVQEVNRQFVERVDGFKVTATASDGKEGLKKAKELEPDLIIIDMYMPGLDGLETLRHIRNERIDTDIIAITAASDAATIRSFLQNGVYDYIIKPFKFERIQESLEKYKAYRQQASEQHQLTQDKLDSMLFHEKKTIEQSTRGHVLPKGLNSITLEKIVSFLETENKEVSAEEVAEGIGIARVTARRYLEHLEKAGRIALNIQYGGIGRPVNRYKRKL